MIGEVRLRLRTAKVLKRRTCRVLGQDCITQRYQSGCADDEIALLRDMRALSLERLRKGLIACSLNVIGGWTANVYRLWKRKNTQAQKNNVETPFPQR